MEARAAGQQQNSGWRSLPRSRCCILLQRSQRNASLRPAVGAGCQWTPTSQSAVLRPRVAGRTPDRQCEVCSSRSAPGLARLGVAGRDSIQLLSLRRCEGNWKVKNKKTKKNSQGCLPQNNYKQFKCNANTTFIMMVQVALLHYGCSSSMAVRKGEEVALPGMRTAATPSGRRCRPAP